MEIYMQNERKDPINTNASSFGDGSFASFEPADPTKTSNTESGDLNIPFITSGPLDTDSAPADPIADASGEATAGKTAAVASDAETKEGAHGFGDGSFATYEGEGARSNPEPWGIGAKAESDPWNIGAKPSSDPWARGEGVKLDPSGATVEDREKESRERAEKKVSTALNVSGWITFFACFPAGFIGLIITVVSFFIGRGSATVPLAVLLAISASSVVIGILINRKSPKKEGTKNIVVGAVISAFLLMMFVSSFGEDSFNLDFFDDPEIDTDAEAEALISSAEEVIGFELPEHDYFYFYDYSVSDKVHKNCDLEYYDLEAEELLGKIKESELFFENIPTPYIGILPDYNRSYEYNFYLIYNADTKEYNKLPAADGDYNMVSILVDYDEDFDGVYVYISKYVSTYRSGFDSDI